MTPPEGYKPAWQVRQTIDRELKAWARVRVSVEELVKHYCEDGCSVSVKEAVELDKKIDARLSDKSVWVYDPDELDTSDLPDNLYFDQYQRKDEIEGAKKKMTAVVAVCNSRDAKPGSDEYFAFVFKRALSDSIEVGVTAFILPAPQLNRDYERS